MQAHEVKGLFKKHYKGEQNIFTPHPISYGKKHNFLYEFSWGECVFDGILYGVTVLELEKGKTKGKFDLCRSFRSKREAKAYIKNLAILSKAETQLQKAEAAVAEAAKKLKVA